jgi:nucleotide-binding universal stress UspA family protein
MALLRRVLHATDFSKASQRAFARAIEFARQNKAELFLVHVLTPTAQYVVGDDYTDPSLYAELDASMRRDAESAMKALAKKAQKAGVTVKTALLRGVAAEQIVQSAKNRHADLIVIGTHGRTGLSKLLMGSVAARVISLAHDPVLTVRGEG